MIFYLVLHPRRDPFGTQNQLYVEFQMKEPILDPIVSLDRFHQGLKLCLEV